MTVTITLVVVVTVVAGIGAAAFGGSLTDLGSGYGGLWGFHLFAHAVPAAVLVGLYSWAIQRWSRQPLGVMTLPFVGSTSA